MNAMRRVYKLVEVDFMELKKGDLFTFDEGHLGPGRLDYTYIVVGNPEVGQDGIPHVQCDFVTGKHLALKWSECVPDKAAMGGYGEKEKDADGFVFTAKLTKDGVTDMKWKWFENEANE